MTLYPSFFISAATVDESTPPDIATTTKVSSGFLLNPNEFNLVIIFMLFIYILNISKSNDFRLRTGR